MAADWLPSREPELLTWFNNMGLKLPTYQAALGLTAGEVAEFQADAALVEFSIQGVEQAADEAREWVAFKNLELYGPVGEPTPGVPSALPPAAVSPRAPGILSRTRALAARIKTHPAYTQAMGADLGLIGPSPSPPSEIKPTGSAMPLPAFTVQISFVKAGHDGVDIEGQRAAETAWTYLAFDAFSPYVDNRGPLAAGQPEQRRYRMRYRDNDVPVGLFSDTLNVTVGP
ncbi:MAG: hypothetical protein WD468_07380 [Pirellulales bacterium]